MSKHKPTMRHTIAEEYRDSDGYWIYLRPGWRICDDLVHGIVESTRAAAYASLRSVVPCDCAECAGLIAAQAANA